MDILVRLTWAVLPGLVVGIVMGFFNHQQKARDQQAEETDIQRKRSEQVRISLLVAAAKLSYAVAMAVKRGKPNGESRRALTSTGKPSLPLNSLSASYSQKKLRKTERRTTMNNLTTILRAYTEGKATLEETNAKLAELGTDLRLDPARNVITEAELTTHGLLDTGTGTLDKVRVTDGRLDHAVNEVSESGTVNMPAWVYLDGKRYTVKGAALEEC